jgi:phage repressor protein C with HTH and peptisase S24 domain
MPIHPKKDSNSFPLPNESIKAFRSFLRRVRDELYDGNAAEMGRQIGLGDQSGQRRLRRNMAPPESDDHMDNKIDDEIVRRTWDELFDRFGIDAFQYAPTPHGAAFLPRLVYKPKKDGGSYVAEPEMNGRYVIDPIEEEPDHEKRSLGQRFVVPIEGDAMVPELHPGMNVIIEPALNPDVITIDSLYLYRMETSVQIRRLQLLPGRTVRILCENDKYDDYEVNLEEDDFEVLGKATARFYRF